MYHAYSKLPSSRNINKIYAQATSGTSEASHSPCFNVVLCLKCRDSPFNSTLKCICVCVCVCVCVLVIRTVVAMSHIRNTNVFVYKLAVKCN